jgi:hypothetical protein
MKAKVGINCRMRRKMNETSDNDHSPQKKAGKPEHRTKKVATGFWKNPMRKQKTGA